ncbi:glutamate-cysteine ligase family protein [Bordetella genomosp. 13]|uniref:glutamate-cysteine ligase family protein n=1 Tax=Bordetella genomosp. 13 TaxID=463040 RepID=UPI0011AA9E6F|nr:glutamate-cysteine ligase family protein [Bordetella genomosp. 13]
MEMAVAARGSGRSHAVGGYFEALAVLKRSRGEDASVYALGSRAGGVAGPDGDSGVDNGYNLLETAFSPVQGGEGGLDRLAAKVARELCDARQALAREGAMLLNVSEHPDCALDPGWYAAVRADRPIYRELVGYRGWLHRVGIDAKAQNGPCTSVGIDQAARALNAVLALAPACIALFANSPLQAGRVTGLKENRLMLWDRMFRHARFAGDHALQQLPERPFDDLGDYFRWMFGAGTASRALSMVPSQGYKSAASVYLAGDPPLRRFLESAQWPGRRADTGELVMLRPHSGYFEYSQFAHFLDARWRYRLASPAPLDELLAAWRRPGGIEELHGRHAADGYIEGRACGAVFADAQLRDEAGAALAATAPLSPSALQLGLMRNLDAAERLWRDWGWLRLRGMRAAAMRDALDDDAVHALARDVLDVARQGLPEGERRWLGYADYVLQTRRTGADRLLELWNAAPGGRAEKLACVSARREVLD